jgi:hypothetical protein
LEGGSDAQTSLETGCGSRCHISGVRFAFPWLQTIRNHRKQSTESDVLTLPKVTGDSPDIPTVVRDYSKLTPPANEVMFALVSFGDGSTLVVPQRIHASEVREAATNIFVLRGTTLTLTGTVNINSVVAVYK